MAPLVVSKVSGNAPVVGGLFEGVAFFLTQRVPQRTGYVKKVEDNGGRVVKLEAQANHIVADHVRKDCPPGSISYTFIDVAIRDGELPEASDHTAGPPVGAIRDVGSAVPGKQTRTAFTAEDDRVLWQWVERAKQQGGLVKGNDIYKQLEARNSRHTFQAWRDRYIKKIMDTPPAGVELTVAANAPPSPPHASEEEVVEVSAVRDKGKQKASPVPKALSREQPQSSTRTKSSGATFKLPRASLAAAQSSMNASPLKLGTQSRVADLPAEVESEDFDATEFQMLLSQAPDIVGIVEDRYEAAWIAFADAYPKHSADEWRVFWEEQVRPEYKRERREERKAARRQQLEAEQLEAEQLEAEQLEAKQLEKADLAVKKAKAARDKERCREDDEIAEREVRTSAKPELTSSQKRKREATASRDQVTYSQKKRKPDSWSLFTDEFEEVEQPVIQQAHHQKSRDIKQPAKPSSRVGPSTQIVEISDDDDEEVVTIEQRVGQGLPVDGVAQEPESNVAAMELDQVRPSGLVSFEEQTLPSDFPTSEAMRAIDQQLQVETREPSSPQQTSNFLTSDANRAADQQLRRESIEDGDDDVEVVEDVEEDTAQHDSNLPTSDANFAAEQQLRQKSLVDEAAEVDGNSEPSRPTSQLGLPLIEPEQELVISNHLIEDGEVEDGLPGEELIYADQGGDALTEANLASQQEQHKDQLLRGADLPVDDEMHDQTDFLSYLQDLVGKKPDPKAASTVDQVTPKVRRAAELRPESPPADVDDTRYTHNDGELPLEVGEPEQPVAAPITAQDEEDELDQTRHTHNETDFRHASDEQPAPMLPELPLSSQQELDDVLEANLQWPYSPLVSQRNLPTGQPESQNIAFETQIPYPTLALQDAGGDKRMFSSQGSQLGDVAYPAFPDHGEASADGEVDTELFFSSQAGLQTSPRRRRQEDVDEQLVDDGHDRAASDGKESEHAILPQGEDRAHSWRPRSVDDHDGREEEELPHDGRDELGRDELAWEAGEFSSYVPTQPKALALGPAVREGGEAVASETGLLMRDEEDEGDDEYEPEDEIDFTIAEPNGGFDFSSSSPARSVASRASHRLSREPDAKGWLQPQVLGEAEDDIDEEYEQDDTVVVTRTQLSSEHDVDLDDLPDNAGARAVQSQEAPIEVSSAMPSSSPYEGSSSPSPGPEEEGRNGGQGLNTQDILDAETQPLDLGMALPPDSDDEEGLPSSPLPTPSPLPEPAAHAVKREPVKPQPKAQPPQPKQRPPAPPPPQHSKPRPPPPQQPNEPRRPQPPQQQPINLAETQTLTQDVDIDAYIAALAARHHCAEADMDIIVALECTSMRPALAELVLVELKAGRGVPGGVAGVWTAAEDAVIERGNATAIRGVEAKHGWGEIGNRWGFLEEWRRA
ncbi:hypothetical protein LTR08_002045 [Meristemomyces frigidus]|nr:hypothetical protein LTR08_002045 [Meristemomyces frigidus]